MLNLSDHRALQEDLAAIAETNGLSPDKVSAEARSALAEMRSRRSKWAMRIFAVLSGFICHRGYDSEYCFDHRELERIKKLSASKSVVYLLTHKTYLDFFVLVDFFHRNGISQPYVFGGINMAFAGFGRLARAAGAIFIRRKFADQPIYKVVLNRYIQSLINEGCSFSWAIEGTRSRTGKLLHPKLGLLKYVAEAAHPLGEDAIAYIPVSVSYDQIPDVAAMTKQEAGATKKPESLSWFIKYIRKLGKYHGKVYLRFGHAIAISQTPDAPDLKLAEQTATPDVISVQKLAFEVCYIINEITPATTISLTILSLLCHIRATEEKIQSDVVALRSYLSINKSSSILKQANPSTPDDVEKAISVLVSNGIITTDDNNYSIVPAQFLVALYYSNMAVHHFVIAAFTELGLINMAHSKSGQRDAAFASEVSRLRDLFKYEFFFSRKDQYRNQFVDELRWIGAPTGSLDAFEAADATAILSCRSLLIGYGVLSPFINAYRLIADQLVRHESESVTDREKFIKSCRCARHNTEINDLMFRSNTLLNNGYLLAENRNLLNGSEAVLEKRKKFADELRLISEQLLQIRNHNR